MIVSHAKKFIFVKTRKTSGTSMEVSLSQVCGPDDIITPISFEDELVRLAGHGRHVTSELRWSWRAAISQYDKGTQDEIFTRQTPWQIFQSYASCCDSRARRQKNL